VFNCKSGCSFCHIGRLVDKSHGPLRDAARSPIPELENDVQVEWGVVADLLPGLIWAPTVIWAMWVRDETRRAKERHFVISDDEREEVSGVISRVTGVEAKRGDHLRMKGGWHPSC